MYIGVWHSRLIWLGIKVAILGFIGLILAVLMFIKLEPETRESIKDGAIEVLDQILTPAE